MNCVASKKYGLSPNEIEKRSLCDKKFRNLFNFHRIEKTRQVHKRLNRYDQKKCRYKRKKLREKLNIGEKVLVLVERIKKKFTLGRSYKQSVQSIAYFNRSEIFLIRKNRLLIK